MNDRFDFDALARDLAQGLSRREALQRLAGGFAGALLATLGLPRITGADPGGNSPCARWCSALPPGADADHCTSDAAHGQGLCFNCGPAAPAGHPDLCGPAGLGATCCPATAPNCCGGSCTNVLGDSSNCGFCGMACAPGESCQDGQCLADCPTCGGFCPPPHRRCGPLCCPLGGDCEVDTGPSGGLLYTCSCPADQCGNVCVDFQTDAGNCGACGAACAAGQSCVGGQCTCSAGASCPAGATCCGGVCAKTQADPRNCGGCGQRCGSGQHCCNGACSDLTSDRNNCGGCGQACPSFPLFETCCNGACCLGTCCKGTCCGFGESCCNGTCCPVGQSCCGNRCVDTSTDPTNCGGCGFACGSGNPFLRPVCCNGVCCGSNAVCVSGQCLG